MPKKLMWTDVEDISFRLIDEYPQTNPVKVRFTDLHKYITGLPDFGDDPKKSNEKVLEAIQMTWLEERADMEDELGPLNETTDDDDFDEDDFREDRMVDDAEDETALEKEKALLEDDDEDGDEFDDGFQEEEVD